jgi:hypothetical protein
MLIVFAGIQDSLEFERGNNNLKRKSTFGKLSVFHLGLEI